jgi:UDP-glucose 4-epimerase
MRGVVGVTGASGHLGQWLTAELLDRGYEVLSISRTPLEAPTINGLKFIAKPKTLAVDLSDGTAIARAQNALVGLDAVVHLAGYIPEDTNSNQPADAIRTLNINVHSTLHLLNALKNSSRLKSFIFASSFEVYGAPQQSPISEDHPTVPLSYYGVSKLTAEKYIALFSQSTGIPSCSVRIPAVYGPGDRLKRAIGNFIRQVNEGQPMIIHGDGSDLRELVFAGDAAKAIALCLEKPTSPVLNIGSGTGFSIMQIAEAVQRVVPCATIHQAERTKPKLDFVLDISLARGELDWEPKTTLEEGIKAQSEWLKNDASIQVN